MSHVTRPAGPPVNNASQDTKVPAQETVPRASGFRLMSRLTGWVSRIKPAVNKPVAGVPDSPRAREIETTLLKLRVPAVLIRIVQGYGRAEPVRLADVDLRMFRAYRLDRTACPDHLGWPPHTQVLVCHHSDPAHAYRANYVGGIEARKGGARTKGSVIYVHGAWDPASLGWTQGLLRRSLVRRHNPDCTCLTALRGGSPVTLYVRKPARGGAGQPRPAFGEGPPLPPGTRLTLSVHLSSAGICSETVQGVRQVPCTVVSDGDGRVRVSFVRAPATFRAEGPYAIEGLEPFFEEEGADRWDFDAGSMDNYFDGGTPWTGNLWEDALADSQSYDLKEWVVRLDEYDGKKSSLVPGQAGTELIFDRDSVLAGKFSLAPAVDDWQVPLKQDGKSTAGTAGTAGSIHHDMPGRVTDPQDARLTHGILMDPGYGRPMTREGALTLEAGHPLTFELHARTDAGQSRTPTGAKVLRKATTLSDGALYWPLQLNDGRTYTVLVGPDEDMPGIRDAVVRQGAGHGQTPGLDSGPPPLDAPLDHKQAQAPHALTECRTEGTALALEQAFSAYYSSGTSQLTRDVPPPVISLPSPTGGAFQVRVMDLNLNAQGRFIATIERADSLGGLPAQWAADGAYKVLLRFGT